MYTFNIKKSTHVIREELGKLTQEEFAKKFDIPIGTVKNWDARKTMPEYIYNMCHLLANAENWIRKDLEECGLV